MGEEKKKVIDGKRSDGLKEHYMSLIKKTKLMSKIIEGEANKTIKKKSYKKKTYKRNGRCNVRGKFLYLMGQHSF